VTRISWAHRSIIRYCIMSEISPAIFRDSGKGYPLKLTHVQASCVLSCVESGPHCGMFGDPPLSSPPPTKEPKLQRNRKKPPLGGRVSSFQRAMPYYYTYQNLESATLEPALRPANNLSNNRNMRFSLINSRHNITACDGNCSHITIKYRLLDSYDPHESTCRHNSLNKVIRSHCRHILAALSCGSMRH
jgi:hypothetical protein